MADAKVGNKKQLQNRKKSAVKATRSALRKRVMNLRRQKAMKESVKSIEKTVVGKSKEEAAKLLPTAYAAIDKAAKRGVIKPNTAARMKSRMARLVSTK